MLLEALWPHLSHAVRDQPLLSPCVCEEKNLREIDSSTSVSLAFYLNQNSVHDQELYMEHNNIQN